MEPPETAEELRAVLSETEDCHRLRQRVDLYATLSRNVSTDSDSAAERQREFRDVDATFDSAMVTVRRALGATAESDFAALLEGLNEYHYYAENLRSQANRVRSRDVEAVIADHGEVRSGADRILRAITTEDFDPAEVRRPRL